MDIPTYSGDVPYVSTEQMIEVDQLMTEAYGIELIQMMENAGRSLAHLARARFFDGDPRGKRVLVLAGTGGNGGGALVCARWLHNFGATVRVQTTREDEAFSQIPRHQLKIVRRMGLAVSVGAPEKGAEAVNLVVDGIIGYSLHGSPRGTAGDLIRWANGQAAPILALDAPSGVDTTTGTVFEPAVRATATMTLALPKEGLRAQGVAALVGELFLADISVPPELYAAPGLELAVPPIFAEADLVRLR